MVWYHGRCEVQNDLKRSTSHPDQQSLPHPSTSKIWWHHCKPWGRYEAHDLDWAFTGTERSPEFRSGASRHVFTKGSTLMFKYLQLCTLRLRLTLAQHISRLNWSMSSTLPGRNSASRILDTESTLQQYDYIQKSTKYRSNKCKTGG